MNAARSWPPIAVAWLLLSGAPASASWTFTEVGAAAGFDYEHGFPGTPLDAAQEQAWTISGGAAAADYDRDGDVDVYAVRGRLGPNLLFRNDGDGTFTEVGAAAGVSGAPLAGSGPVFADIDGDGWLDLLVGGIDGSPPGVYRNQGDGTFQNVSFASGFAPFGATFSLSLADYDRDDDLDIAAVHWAFDLRVTLWKNDGDGHFLNVTAASGLQVGSIYGFSPTFSDIDGDGWLDLLVAADFGTSRIFLNDGDGTFTETTTPVIDDENGMGAAAFDYDHDGDVDWFVTSVWDPDQTPEGNWGVSGNRLYRNDGDGVFEDATDEAGVRVGFWGWGACAHDFDNDGHTDLFHTNGFDIAAATEFFTDPSRLFHAQGDGTFVERSAELGIVDTGQGRGAVCFDYDDDGDVDVFVANNGGPPSFYRNDGPTGEHLRVRLVGTAGNVEGIGAVVRATVGATTQTREIRAGTNFESSEPAIAHFGTGVATVVDEVRVEWPDGAVTTELDVATGQELVVFRTPPEPTPVPTATPGPTPSPSPAPVPGPGAAGLGALALGLLGLAARRLRAGPAGGN